LASPFADGQQKLQPQTLLTVDSRETSFKNAVLGYVSGVLSGLEDIPDNKNICRMREAVDGKLLELKRSAGIPGHLRDFVPVSCIEGDDQVSVVIYVGEFMIRYFDPNVPGAGRAGGDDYELTYTEIGKYLTKQVLKRNPLSQGNVIAENAGKAGKKEDAGSTLKSPGSLSPDEDNDIDRDYFNALTADSTEVTGELNVAGAVDLINANAQRLKGEAVRAEKVKIFSVNGLDGLPGMPIAAGASRRAKDLIYAYGRKGADGSLEIYITKDLHGKFIKGSELALAELIDHEYTENILGKQHAVAASRAMFFKSGESTLSPFHKLFIDLVSSESDFSLLDSLFFARKVRQEVARYYERPLQEKIQEYEKDFYAYLRLKKWLAAAADVQDADVLAEYAIRIAGELDKNKTMMGMLSAGEKSEARRILPARFYVDEFARAGKGDKTNPAGDGEINFVGKFGGEDWAYVKLVDGHVWKRWTVERGKVTGYKEMRKVYSPRGVLTGTFNGISESDFNSLGDCAVKGLRVGPTGVLAFGRQVVRIGEVFAYARCEAVIKSSTVDGRPRSVIDSVKIYGPEGRLLKQVDFILKFDGSGMLLDSFQSDIKPEEVEGFTGKLTRLRTTKDAVLKAAGKDTAFSGFGDSEAEVHFKEGIITKVDILPKDGSKEETREFRYHLVFNSKGALTASFRDCGKDEFAGFKDHTMKAFKLDKDGALIVGGKEWLRLPKHAGKEVEFKVLNGAVSEVTVMDGQDKVGPFYLSLIYSVDDDGEREIKDSFYGQYNKLKALRGRYYVENVFWPGNGTVFGGDFSVSTLLVDRKKIRSIEVRDGSIVGMTDTSGKFAGLLAGKYEGPGPSRPASEAILPVSLSEPLDSITQKMDLSLLENAANGAEGIVPLELTYAASQYSSALSALGMLVADMRSKNPEGLYLLRNIENTAMMEMIRSQVGKAKEVFKKSSVVRLEGADVRTVTSPLCIMSVFEHYRKEMQSRYHDILLQYGTVDRDKEYTHVFLGSTLIFHTMVTAVHAILLRLQYDGYTDSAEEEIAAIMDSVLDAKDSDEAYRRSVMALNNAIADLHVVLQRKKWDKKGIEANLKEMSPRLAAELMRASEYMESGGSRKCLILIDESFGENGIQEARVSIHKVIRALRGMKDNNGELRAFLENIEIRAVADTQRPVVIPEKMDPADVIAVIDSSNRERFAAIDGMGVVAAIDRDGFPETGYLPIAEVLLLAVEKFLGKDGKDLFRYYQNIPNVVPLTDLDVNQISGIFSKDARSFVIRLIPGAEAMPVKDLVELLAIEEDVLQKA
jgi:hypothetical protein